MAQSTAASSAKSRDADSEFHFDETWKPRFNPWVIAFTVTLATFMEALDSSIANVALPHIAGSLGASYDEATWILTSYLVSNAIILPISGWIANRIGRKRFYMSCVVAFTFFSFCCGLANSLALLVVFRIFQGAAGGGLQPSERAILADTFAPHKRSVAFAIYGMAVVVAPAIGPTIGGWITDNYTWRWIFFLNIPVGILSILLTSRIVEDPPYLKRVRKTLGSVDGIGLGLLALTIGALQIMLDKGQEKDWFGSILIRALCVVALVCLTSFVLRELRAKDPIVHFSLLRSRTFASGVVLVTIMGFVLYGSLVLLPLFMQTLLGWTATTAGIWNSPRGVGTALCMPLVAFLLGRGWDARRLLILGFAITGLCFFGYARMTLESGTWDIFWIQIVQGFALGFLFVPMATLTMSPIPKAETGYATSLFNTMRNIGSSMGISFVTTLMARREQFHQQVLGNHFTPSSPLGQQAMAQLTPFMAHQGFDHVTAAQKAGGLLYRMLQQQAALLSYADAFLLMGILILLNIPIVLLMRGAEHNRRHRRNREAHGPEAARAAPGS
jgi:DHA2 family multidrug resistance protein